MGCMMVLISVSHASPFPRYRFSRLTHDSDEKRLFVTTKQEIDPKSELTMTVHNGRPRQAIINLQKDEYSLDHMTQDYVSLIVVSALHEEISFKRVLRANRTPPTKLTVFVLELRISTMVPKPDVKAACASSCLFPRIVVSRLASNAASCEQ